MPPKSLDELETALFETKNGSDFSYLKKEMLKAYARKTKSRVLAILMRYSKEGDILHWRHFILPDIIELCEENSEEQAEFFRWAIDEPEFMYWSIEGLLKTGGKSGYAKLVEIASDNKLDVEDRGKAIKSLAQKSGQRFDRRLKRDPGHWEKEQLRVEEVLEWQKHGYPDGPGYETPNVHPSLKNPQSEFEQLIVKWDKKLAKDRDTTDFCNPGNWLVIASAADMDAINRKWPLPTVYRVFLEKYSPVEVMIYSRKYTNFLRLYGATELIKHQEGYSFDPIKKEVVTNWPQNLVVIADDGGDPFCLDLSQTQDGDAPVYKSLHGTGEWKFQKYAANFRQFLEKAI